MKLRTSSFKTILCKDILRFAPLWALYLIGGILVLLSVTDTTEADYAAVRLSSTVTVFGIVNIIYAALAAQLLFGDLFNSRMCNALHAMPMRRETWFMSHVISGLCFSLVPNLIMTLAMMPVLGDYWYIGFVWLLGMTLEYLCFFGLAVFSVFCTGNRFAMVAVYGVLNFFALIVLWFVTTIYQPLLYGFAVAEETFYTFSPLLKMVDRELIETSGAYDTGAGFVPTRIYMTQEWWCLAGYAAIGAVLLGAGLLLYRRRKLECAGNFMAVKSLAPIFSVIFALFVGALFAMFGYNGNGTEDYLHLIFLSVGLVVGYFTGQMLLQRTVKVFKPMAFAKLAVLVVIIFTSIGLTVWDPLGFEEWVPEADEVQSVTLTGSAAIWDRHGNLIEIQDQGIIENIIDLHKMALRNGEYDGSRYISHVNINITYTMKDGRTVKRRYSTTYDGTRDEYIELIREYKSIAVAAQ